MMRKALCLTLTALFIIPLVISCAGTKTVRTITVFAGAASKPALEEAGQVFTEKEGIRVDFNFGGSGTVLSQMKLSRSGDLYIPGSPDYVVKAQAEGVVEPESVRILAYLIPVINVQRGNPKNIQSLADLAKPGIKVSIANPEVVCLGLYAVEMLEYNQLLAEVMQNVVTYAESCEKTATLVSLKAVDAVIGWHVFHSWDPDNIDLVYLKPEQFPRIAYIPAAIATFANDRDAARRFRDFLVSAEGRKIFNKWGYIATEEEARKFSPGAQIGGEYKLPEAYYRLLGTK